RVVGDEREGAQAGFDESARAGQNATVRQSAAGYIHGATAVQRGAAIRRHGTSRITQRAAVENQVCRVAAGRADAAGRAAVGEAGNGENAAAADEGWAGKIIRSSDGECAGICFREYSRAGNFSSAAEGIIVRRVDSERGRRESADE